MKILGYILVIFAAANFASSFADETKLKLRKVKNNNAGSENISIKINPEMFIVKDLKEFRKHKITMSYNYFDKNGEFITNIDVTPAMYEGE